MFSSLSSLLALITAVGLSPAFGANLVMNGGFTHPETVTVPTPPRTMPDRRVPGWVMSAEWHIDGAQGSPDKEVRILRAAGGADRSQQLSQQIYLEAGKKYTLSAWIRSEGLTKGDSRSGEQQTGILLTNWDWTQAIRLPLPSGDGDKWVRKSITFTAPKTVLVAGIAQPCQLRVYLPKEERGTLWVGGLQLEEGGKMTAFDPVSVQEIDRELATLGGFQRRIANAEGTLANDFEASAAAREAVATTGREVEAAVKRLRNLKGIGSAEWQALQEELKGVGAKARRIVDPLVWWEEPWRDLPRKALPDSFEIRTNRLRITLAKNDYGAAVLALSNLGRGSLSAEVFVGGPIAPFSTLSTMKGAVQVSQVLFVSNEGSQSQIRAQEGFQSHPYHLNPLGNGNTMLIPGAETTQLWFDVSSANLSVGVHRFPVRLIGLEGAYRWEGEIEVEVLPLELPRKVPANVIAYAGQPFFSQPFSPLSPKTPLLKFSAEERLALAGDWLRAWQEMGFNRVMLTSQMVTPKFNDDGTLAEPLDFSVLEAYKALFDTIGADYWGGYSIARYHLPQQVSADAEKRVRAYLDAFVEGVKAMGLSPQSYPLNMYDEPHGMQLKVMEQATKVLREVAPEWKTISTVSGSTRAKVEPLMPWVDILVVRQRMGEMDMAPEVIRYLKDKGKEVWGYACSGSHEYMHPYRYYRLLAWQAWQNGLGGYGVYMSMLPERFEVQGPRAAFYTPLFYGKEGPVYGKGARAFQLAGRDWCIFTSATDTAKLAREKGMEPEARDLQRLLDESVRSVLEDETDFAHADKMRVELMTQIIRLRDGVANAAGASTGGPQ